MNAQQADVLSIPLYSPEATASALRFDDLIPALRDAFSQGAEVPLRHQHQLLQKDGTQATLLVMPAWQPRGDFLGIKIVTVYPGNADRNLPGLHSTYLLCDAETGRHLALIDGNQITVRRTVGVAALGASFLARRQARTLLVVGAGRVGSMTPYAFKAVRPIEEVRVWDIDRTSSERLAARLVADGFNASIADDLEAAARTSDIVSCATLSHQPLIRFEWLSPGTHLDLIGSFTPAMREADDACFVEGTVYIDSPDALVESGDLLQPIEAGVFKPSDIVGTLSDLCQGKVDARITDEQVTVFKAVGTGLSDLAAGSLAYRNLQALA